MFEIIVSWTHQKILTNSTFIHINMETPVRAQSYIRCMILNNLRPRKFLICPVTDDSTLKFPRFEPNSFLYLNTAENEYHSIKMWNVYKFNLCLKDYDNTNCFIDHIVQTTIISSLSFSFLTSFIVHRFVSILWSGPEILTRGLKWTEGPKRQIYSVISSRQRIQNQHHL